MFADDVVFEDPATVTRATDRTELDSFFGGAIPADWVLAFGFVRSSVVGDEAILTYTVRLTIADRSPSELFVNSHVRVNADGLIESMRVFYDAESITDF